MLAKHSGSLMSVGICIICLLFAASGTVFAEPYLQLDASPSNYIYGDEESIVATDTEFTLYALVNSNSNKISDDGDGSVDPARVFYLSAAVTPPQDAAAELGSIVIDGVTINITEGMNHGTPPLYELLADLGPHGIYETYYKEIDFTLSGATRTDLYDSQFNPREEGGPGAENTNGDLYYMAFDVDISGLAEGYGIHFDLYTIDGDKVYFAPYSHDATVVVPIPPSVALGMLGLVITGLKLRKFA